MFHLADLLSIAAAFVVVAVSPGPANIALAAVAMSSGRKNALLFGAGLGVGLAFWGVVAATGLGALLQGSAYLLGALKLFGGLYLLWLAYKSARTVAKPENTAPEPAATGRWFRRGLVLNLSNPKAVVAWMAALSMGLGSGDGGAQVMVATFMCIALGFANYAGYALVFSLTGVMAGYRRGRRWIDGSVAALFAMAGFGLIRSAFVR